MISCYECFNCSVMLWFPPSCSTASCTAWILMSPAVFSPFSCSNLPRVRRQVAQLPVQITAEGPLWMSKTEHFLSFGGAIGDTSEITCGPEWDHSELFMCFLPCALLISVWHCRDSGVRPGHAFKLLLQPSAPQAAIIAIDTARVLLDFKSNTERMSWVKMMFVKHWGGGFTKLYLFLFVADEVIVSLLFTTISQISHL